jgi:UDP-glucose 4-epimerase
MKALVTGGAGFIGSNLVDVLLARGYEVVVLDNLSVGKIENIAHHLDSSAFEFVQDSILNISALEPLIHDADLVFHLAAVVGVKHVLDDPLGAIVTNVRGTENVLNLAFTHGKRAVIASSSEVYGKSTDVPLKEDSDRILGPTTVDRWSYSDAKAIDEYVAFAYARQGMPVTAVRYFNSYGPRIDPLGYGSVVARFITQATQGDQITVFDDGEQTRCFTYVADTVEGTILAATLPDAVGRVINIGSDQEITVNALAQLIHKLVGADSEIVHIPSESAFGPRFEEIRRRVPDVTRAQQLLGFKAATPLEEGLRRTIEWFEENVTHVINATECTT